MNVNLQNLGNLAQTPFAALGAGAPPADNQLAQLQETLLAVLAQLAQGLAGAGNGNPGAGLASASNPSFGAGAGGGNPVSGFLGGSSRSGGSPARARKSASTKPASSSGRGSGDAAVEYARRFKGKDSSSIKGKMKHFTAAGGITNNCADFVSSALESKGLVKGHHINVNAFEKALKQQGYKQVPAKQAKPGDVWISQSRGHTELVATKGATRLIGSNNNGDSRQEISEHATSAAGVIYQKKG